MEGSEVQLTISGRTCRVGRQVGMGGQGVVFEAAIDGTPGRHALKWYSATTATEPQWRTIFNLIDIGPPNPRFVWPTDVATRHGDTTFGYVMPFRDEGYVTIAAAVRGDVSLDFRAVATFGLQLAESFLHLHSSGLCYRDINLGNIFVSPASGDIRICDNDNVGVAGEEGFNVLGQRMFMAPEIWREEALPSTSTDLYSLAVMLFQVFMLDHPLIGVRRNDFPGYDEEAANLSMLGRSPLFVFDPGDPSNAPDPLEQPAVMAHWPLYPQFLRDLFTEAFTKGLDAQSHNRVSESRWRAAMARLRDSVVDCQSCERPGFFDAVGPPPRCWSCGSLISLPLKLVLGRDEVMLTATTKLFEHHLRRNYVFDDAVAEVVRHPQDPSVWGLRNLGDRSWTVGGEDGTSRVVEPGRSATLRAGATFNFGLRNGRVGRGNEPSPVMSPP